MSEVKRFYAKQIDFDNSFVECVSANDYDTQNGHDRIVFLGGDCDSVAKMEADDPHYSKARAFLAASRRAAQEQQS